MLPYEQAQTRQVPRRAGWYNLSTHFPWIGMRTAQLERRARRVLPRHPQPDRRSRSAPAMTRETAAATCSTCSIPSDEPGRLTLIHRLGARDIALRAAAADRGGAARPARTRAVVLRSDARQHRDDRERHQDAALRRHPRRARAGVRRPRRARHATSAASTSSSPARTSPSASAARAASPRPTSTATTGRSVDPRLNYEQALEMALLVGRKMGSLAAQAVRV